MKKEVIEIQSSHTLTRRRKITAIIVRDAMLEAIREKKRVPSAEELGKKIGVTSRTIERAMATLKFNEEAAHMRPLTNDVLLSIYRSAIGGSVAAQKLWLQAVEGWNERTENTTTVTVATWDDVKREMFQ